MSIPPAGVHTQLDLTPPRDHRLSLTGFSATDVSWATRMLVSIYNDVIGPIMRGGSSSHCAAALRIGRLARDLMGGTPETVLVEFDRAGSLPTTHESQGSDMGLFGGLLGWEADDPRLPESPAALLATGADLRIETVDVADPHPNTYRLTLTRGGCRHSLRAISTGGGMIELIAVDEIPLSVHGGYHETLFLFRGDAANQHAADLAGRIAATEFDWEPDALEVHHADAGTLVQLSTEQPVSPELSARLVAGSAPAAVHSLAPVLPVRSRRGMQVPFNSAAQLLAADAGRGSPLWRHAIDYEMARGGLSEREVIDRMVAIVRLLKGSIAEGIAGTAYEDRILPAQAPGFAAALAGGRLLGDALLNRIVLATTALMEVKSSMGVIVAAPTAGACAALPAAVIAAAESLDLDEEAMARAMLAAGLVGVFICTPWSFAAEVGGCQAEGGSAAAMAAAGLVTLADGTLEQALAAASLALQSMLGLICDPVAGRVEVPCLGKNVMAAANALACCNMALAGFAEVIPFDEVVASAARVAGQMPRELRCTTLGGLAITPAASTIADQLAARKAATCGVAGCGCR
ncbi:MAG: L-serine ammonia-lyase, iron-sulfur-dependent, subunit alpha [Planctomycetota bacterium]|jgi:L-serine dehydratase|nr:L-serine ammonia-lyase, iron-sulfur-dependent, subunit alpha [Planctomycetota bacterium]